MVTHLTLDHLFQLELHIPGYQLQAWQSVPTGLALTRLTAKESACLLSQSGTNPELQQLQ